MNGYQFSMTCPECGSDVVHVADGISSGRQTRAVANCTACKRSWVVIVQLGVGARG